MTVLRVAAHVHSAWSFDGTWSLAAIARSFRRRGYDAVLLAEHSQSLDEEMWVRYKLACRRASLGNLLLVPGVEYRDASNTIHLPVWGDLPYLGDGRPIGELLAEVTGLSGSAVLAHPGRHAAHDLWDPAWTGHLKGVEVWNRKYDGWAPNPTALALARDSGVPAFAALDFHGRRQFFPLSMELKVSEPVTADAIYRGVSRGHLRSTFLRRPVSSWSSRRPMSVLHGLERTRKRVAPLLRSR